MGYIYKITHKKPCTGGNRRERLGTSISFRADFMSYGGPTKGCYFRDSIFDPSVIDRIELATNALFVFDGNVTGRRTHTQSLTWKKKLSISLFV